MVKAAKASYFADLISSNKQNSEVVIDTINNIVSAQPPAVPVFSDKGCSNFLWFFVDKAATPSLTTPIPALPKRQPILECFLPISLQDLTELVMSMKISSSLLDILPTTLLKKVFSSIGSSLLSIINYSLVSGCVPSLFKQAVVQPLLKKPNLDPSVFSNYQPISKLPFISKILEKVVANQLVTALNKHNIFDKFQSGEHSTETALLRVSNDIMMASDADKCTILVLLDLRVAFDTVDHSILLDRLRDWVGITGSAFKWFASHLLGRSFSVAVGPRTSKSVPLSCGVPRRSVLGPILFTLYMLPFGDIIRRFNGISYHMYADDLQLYFSFKPDRTVYVLHDCLSVIKDWMANNFLQLNASKTEVLIVAPNCIVSKLANCIGSLTLLNSTGLAARHFCLSHLLQCTSRSAAGSSAGATFH